jgi:hypothetical protein
MMFGSGLFSFVCSGVELRQMAAETFRNQVLDTVTGA